MPSSSSAVAYPNLSFDSGSRNSGIEDGEHSSELRGNAKRQPQKLHVRIFESKFAFATASADATDPPFEKPSRILAASLENGLGRTIGGAGGGSSTAGVANRQVGTNNKVARLAAMIRNPITTRRAIILK